MVACGRHIAGDQPVQVAQIANHNATNQLDNVGISCIGPSQSFLASVLRAASDTVNPNPYLSSSSDIVSALSDHSSGAASAFNWVGCSAIKVNSDHDEVDYADFLYVTYQY